MARRAGGGERVGPVEGDGESRGQSMSPSTPLKSQSLFRFHGQEIFSHHLLVSSAAPPSQNDKRSVRRMSRPDKGTKSFVKLA